MTGEEMSALRKKHGLSQTQLAEILGVKPGHVSAMENGRRYISDKHDARLSEWDLTGPHDTPEKPSDPDELPEPPYNPGDNPVEAVEDEKPKRGSRSPKPVTSGPRRLTQVQDEAAKLLTTLLQGQSIALPALEGMPSTIVIPGVCHGVAEFWCPICAQILGNAAPAFSVALVRAYPNIAQILARPGAKAELIIVTVQTIVVPCVMHHIHPRHAPEPSANGGAGFVAGESVERIDESHGST